MAIKHLLPSAHFLLPLLTSLVWTSPLFSQDLIVAGPEIITDTATYDNVIVQSDGVLTVDGVLIVNQSMVVEGNGMVTHSPRFENGLHLVVNDTLVVQSMGSINTDGMGLKGGNNSSIFGALGEAYDINGNIVAGSSQKFGGSHGGMGAQSTNSGGASNPAYGLIEAPDKLGAGGGGGVGGNGGGRIRIEAGYLILEGTISANGIVGQGGAYCGGGGGGAGGSIWITVSDLSGMGPISATGGPGANNCQGGGGGGRVTVEYTTATFSFGNIHVAGNSHRTPGGAGTVYLKNSSEPNGEIVFDNNGIDGTYFSPFLTSLSNFKKITIRENAEVSYSLTNISTDEFIDVTGGKFTMEANSSITDPKIFLSQGVLTSHTSLVITDSANFHMENASSVTLVPGQAFHIPAFDATNFTGGVFNLQQGAQLHVGSDQMQVNTGMTLIKDGQFGADDVIGQLDIEDGGSITHSGHLEQGLYLEVTGTLNIKTGGAINVDGKGLYGGGVGGNPFGSLGETYDANGVNAAGSDDRNGGSHGGRGGIGRVSNGGAQTGMSSPTYGLLEIPDKLGAGGGGSVGGNGGGKVRIVSGSLIVDGTITANGANGQSAAYCGGGGGGAGGSVWVTTSTLTGAGALSANGGNRGNNCQGAGGGGRIAIEYTTNTFPTENISVASPPDIHPGGAGTIYLKDAAEPFGTLIVDNNGQVGKYETPILSNLTNFKKVTVKERAALIHSQGSIEAQDLLEVLQNGYFILDTFATLANPVVNLNQGNFYARNDISFANASDFQMNNQSYLEIGTTTEFAIPAFDTTNIKNGNIYLLQDALLNIGANQAVINSGVQLIKHGKFGTADELAQLTVESGGSITHQLAYHPGLSLEVTGTLEVKTGGLVNVTAKGLRGGTYGSPFNPNGEAFDENGDLVSGATDGVGGSYGGEGAIRQAQQGGQLIGGVSNTPYGKIESPDQLGAGGGGAGGHGGGRVFIQASALILDGQILANGNNGTGLTYCGGGGGGAGGSVWIIAQNFSGDGAVEAIGGNSGNNCQGAGGGGRIAVEYTSSTFPEANLKAYGGAIRWPGSNGTVFLKQIGTNSGKLIFDNNNINSRYYAWGNSDVTEFTQVIARNNGKGILPRSGTIHFPAINPANGISGTIAIPDNLQVMLDDYNIEIGNGFTLEKSGTIGATDSLPQVIVRNGGRLGHMTRSVNGLRIKTASLTVEQNGSIDVTGKGLLGGNNGSQFGYYGETYAEDLQSIAQGAVGGTLGAGGSYGGLGETANDGGQPNPTYGDEFFPDLLGSGGGGGAGFPYEVAGNGGGKMMLRARHLLVAGGIHANGGNGNSHVGGGSGGSILVFADTIAGNGVIQANGGVGGCGACTGGSGGGGRIAIYSTTPDFPPSNIFVDPGPPNFGIPEVGTIVYQTCDFENNVGVDTILIPPPLVVYPVDTAVSPMVVARNFSPNPLIFPVSFSIGNFYSDETYVNLEPGERDTILFSPWEVAQSGAVTATAQTNMNNDDCTENNMKEVVVGIDTGEGPVLTTVSPGSGGNTGSVTVKMTGLHFHPETMAWIEEPNGGGPNFAHYVDWRNEGFLFASFNLMGLQPGIYDVYVQNPDGQSAFLVGSFAVEEGPFMAAGFTSPDCLETSFDLTGFLETEFTYPQAVRRFSVFPVIVRFVNTSNIDIPLPTRTLISIHENPVSFSEEEVRGVQPGDPDMTTTLTVRFEETGGPANILRAGATGTFRFYSKAIYTQAKFKIVD